MNQWKVVAAFLLLCAGSLRAENPKFHPLTDGGIGLARYRVAIDFSTAADPDAFVRQLLATCRCRQEPYAELGFEGVMIVATPAAAELLSRDARVVTVDEVPPLPAAVPPPAPATPPPSIVELTPVSIAPTAPTMSAVSSETQLVVPSPTTDSTAFWSRSYGYDKSGNVITAGTDKYAYDRLGRVAYADAGQGKNQKYTYDRYGNLLTIIENDNTSATVDLRPDPATNRISGNGNVIAQYDTAGRMTSATGLIAKYDGEDTVVESTIQNGTTVRRVHLYSAAGERVATLTVNNSGHELSSAWTIRDPGGKVLRRLSRTNGLPGSWRWDEDYIYRDSQMLAAEVDTPARTLHYHLDQLGTPRVITGNGGAVVGQHTYHAFGKEASEAPNPIQETEALKFTGHERDAEFLDYMHARYYNAYWGRFLTVDPGKDWNIRQPQRWNLYSYARNKPTAYVDPDGASARRAIEYLVQSVTTGLWQRVTRAKAVQTAASGARHRVKVRGGDGVVHEAKSIVKDAFPGEKVLHHAPHVEDGDWHFQPKSWGLDGQVGYEIIKTVVGFVPVIGWVTDADAMGIAESPLVEGRALHMFGKSYAALTMDERRKVIESFQPPKQQKPQDNEPKEPKRPSEQDNQKFGRFQ